MEGTPAAGLGQLSDLDKARLFLRAVNSFTLAEAALRRRDKLKPALRFLVDRLLSQWQATEAQARRLPHQEVLALLRQYMEPLDERMVQGQRDIEGRYLRREKVGSLFLAWGFLYFFRTKALDLVEELAGAAPGDAGSEAGKDKPLPANQPPPDLAALREFQMALNMAP